MVACVEVLKKRMLQLTRFTLCPALPKTRATTNLTNELFRQFVYVLILTKPVRDSLLFCDMYSI